MLFNILCVSVPLLLFFIGIFIVFDTSNYMKKLFGLSIVQLSAIIFFIIIGYVQGGAIPVIKEGIELYNNPLPHVLMLTAIVVGVATFAVGLAIIIKIKEEFKSIEE